MDFFYLNKKIKELKKENRELKNSLSKEAFKNENYKVFHRYKKGDFITSDILVMDIKLERNITSFTSFMFFIFRGLTAEKNEFFITFDCFDLKAKKEINLTLKEVEKLASIDLKK